MIGGAWKHPIILLLFITTCHEKANSFQLGSSMTRTPVHGQQFKFPFAVSSYSPYSRDKSGSQSKSSISKLNPNSNPLKETSLRAEAVADADDNLLDKKKVPFPIVIWRFTRPHTLIGSALAIPALHIFAAPTFNDAFKVKTLISALFAMVPSLLMNLYITGLNQITDVEIDKVNKPNLPIAAGDLSPKTATIVVIASLIASLALGVSNPVLGTQGLNVALWGSMILGTMYSLEPFRLKKFPFLAAFCIVVVRGTIINAGFYAHAKAAAFGASGVSATVLGCMSDPRCFLSSLFFAIFGVVIGTYSCL